jgi:outer membrane usher protein FimD/PapC
MKYMKKPKFSSNYRYGVTANSTVGAGLQFYEGSYALDAVTIFATPYGLISPNVAFTHSESKGSHSDSASGVGIFYALPKNNFGIYLEVFVGLKEKCFGDLNKSAEQTQDYDHIITKYFPTNLLKEKFLNGLPVASSSRQVISRIYTKPLDGFLPSFTFNGVWSKSNRLREYTFALTRKFEKCCTITVSAGLTYDDPHKGVNLQSPDRRLNVACTIPVGTEWEIAGTYSHHDDERLRSYAKVQYKPSSIKGLELTAEDSFRSGFRNPCFKVAYDGEHCNLKVEEALKNQFDNGTPNIKPSHKNQQRFFFGTSATTNGLNAHQKSSFNVLRNGKKYATKKVSPKYVKLPSEYQENSK